MQKREHVLFGCSFRSTGKSDEDEPVLERFRYSGFLTKIEASHDSFVGDMKDEAGNGDLFSVTIDPAKGELKFWKQYREPPVGHSPRVEYSLRCKRYGKHAWKCAGSFKGVDESGNLVDGRMGGCICILVEVEDDFWTPEKFERLFKELYFASEAA